MNALAEFEVFISRSGLPSAVHLPSQTLVHSRVNPLKEAEDIASAYRHEQPSATIIVGGGLGYLPESVKRLSKPNHTIFVLEPRADLYALAKHTRRNSGYVTSLNIRVMTVATPSVLAAQMTMIPGGTNVIVSPYLLRLSEHQDFPLSGFLQIARAELASRTFYNPLLAGQSQSALERLAKLPSAGRVKLPDNKLTVIAGAGPSLTPCLSVLASFRADSTLLAVSGAVPALLAAHITPDWVFALEAKDSVTTDLEDLPSDTKVVVFPSTHPQIILSKTFNLFASDSGNEERLETRGGSSAIPALDFALRCARGDIALVGLDLSNANGTYATNSRRDFSNDADSRPLPPKFLSMRAGLDRVLHNRQGCGRNVYHVLLDSVPLLKGTLAIGRSEFQSLVHQRSKTEVQCD